MSLYAEVVEKNYKEMEDGWICTLSVTGLWKSSKASFQCNVRQEG